MGGETSMAAQKSKPIDVTIKPWWQTQLFAAIVGATLASIPYVYDKIQSNDEKRDSIGLAFLRVENGGPFTFTDLNKNSFSVRLVGSTFENADTWILFNKGAEKVVVGRGVRQGRFFAYLDNLNCGATYYYRAEANREGRIAAGQIQTINFPKCETPADIARAEADTHFLADRTRLRDPNLPTEIYNAPINQADSFR
jgi:hypothetical protein